MARSATQIMWWIAGSVAAGRSRVHARHGDHRQAGGCALADTEQFGFGGADLVRGYTLDDGAFDTGVVLRNTLSLPAVPLLGGAIGSADAFQPYLFLDAAYAHDRFTGANAKPASVGVGSSYHLGRIFSGRMDLARALNSTAYTHAGGWRAQASATVSF